MILEALATAVRTRLAADSTLMGYVSSSTNVLTGQVPAEAGNDVSCIVINMEINSTNDTSDKDIDVVDVSLLVRISRRHASGPNVIFSALDRIHGDGVDNSGNAPTYGLHRHTLTLAGGAATTHGVTAMRRINSRPVDVDNPEKWLAYESTYRVNVFTK